MNSAQLARVDLNLLVLFDVVLAERHVGRAADRLRLTPSAVSHGLGRLRRLLNDPLFLKTPKGVVPTARAEELGAPVADVLARALGVIATAEPFEPSSSRRRFTLGAPDGVSAVFLPPLLDGLRRSAPGIDISVLQLLPVPGETSPERAWRNASADLDAHAMDIAVIPHDRAPARFDMRRLYEEDFVIAARAGHRFLERPTLESYCAEDHLVVSFTGDREGFVDHELARQGRSRRVALNVPNFMLALALIAETDLVAALPSRFIALHGRRFDVVGVTPPLRLPRFHLSAMVPRVALMDAGLAWLLDELCGAELTAPSPALRRSPRKPRG